MDCPMLKDGYFHVDYRGADPVEYTLEIMTCSPIIKKYVNGDSLRRYLFAVSSREYFSADRVQNIGNIAFYEELAAWVERQDKLGIFPDLPEGHIPKSLSALSSGYLFDESMESARYQIQLELRYLKKALW